MKNQKRKRNMAGSFFSLVMLALFIVPASAGGLADRTLGTDLLHLINDVSTYLTGLCSIVGIAAARMASFPSVGADLPETCQVDAEKGCAAQRALLGYNPLRPRRTPHSRWSKTNPVRTSLRVHLASTPTDRDAECICVSRPASSAPVQPDCS